MDLFKINWQHNYKGERSNNEKIKGFEPIPELNLSAKEAAENYAKSLSSGLYSVSKIKESK